MTFNLSEQRGQLGRLVGHCREPEPLQSLAVETAQIETLISIRLPSTRYQRGSRPERFGMIDGRVKLDHVGAGNNFVKHCERWGPFGIAHAFPFLLLGQCDFDFNFTQTLDQRLDAGGAQSLDQLVSWGFVSVRQ